MAESSADKISPAVLSALIRRLLPNPLSELPEPFLKDLTKDEASALEMIESQLKLKREQVTETSYRSKVLNRISQLLVDSTLSGGRQRAAAQRLGLAGSLPLSAYTINYGELLKRFEGLGVKQTHVEEAVAAPDGVEHLFPEANDKFPRISLIAKRINPKRHRSFIALIQAERRGDELVLQALWRLPESISFTPLHQSSESGESGVLLELLRSFVDRFGLLIEVRDMPARKFIFREEVQIGPEDLGRSFKVLNPRNVACFTSLLMKVEEGQIAQIALAYAIDTDTYKREIRLEMLS